MSSSSLAFIFGVLPLAISTGAGANSRIAIGTSVIGGYVYRGKRSRSYQGVYIFGDWDSKRVWGLKQRNGKLLVIRQIATSPGKVSSFGVDHEGEIYVVGYDDGMIYRLCLEESVFE